jgi:RHS repeat-associated protein
MNLRKLFTAVVALLALSIGTQAFAARTTTYYHNDGLGSVVAATNEAGQVLWRKDYAPFGEQIDTTPDTEKQSYTGKPHDEVTGLTYFGGRYYDPQVARFMSVDPVAFVDDNTMSFNRYLYVNNNPYKYVDPDGEFLNFVAKFVLDVGINVAFNYVTTGQLNVGGALKESALGVLNPAKTMAKAGKLASHMAKGRKIENVSEAGFAAKATKRPSRVRKGTEQDNWDKAKDGPTGGKICPTCGKEVRSPPKTSNKDWQNDHDPKWKDRDLTGKARPQVLDEYNKGTRLRCTPCNVSDNQ